MHHAADDVLRRNRRIDLAARVDRLQLRTRQAAAEAALEKPPGHAIHGREHDRLGAKQRGDLLRDGRKRRRLHRDHHQLLHAQRFRIGAGMDRH